MPGAVRGYMSHHDECNAYKSKYESINGFGARGVASGRVRRSLLQKHFAKKTRATISATGGSPTPNVSGNRPILVCAQHQPHHGVVNCSYIESSPKIESVVTEQAPITLE